MAWAVVASIVLLRPGESRLGDPLELFPGVIGFAATLWLGFAIAWSRVLAWNMPDKSSKGKSLRPPASAAGDGVNEAKD